jgi:tryptophan halogenase
MAQERITEVVIAGGGTAGWMAAAALSRFLGSSYRITLVESDAIGTVGVGEATIPQIHLFNAALGFDEAEFLAATKATIKLGIEFVDWLRPDHRYMHAFGHVGRALGIVPFHHYWLRARASGDADDYGSYSFNETAARSGRFAKGDGRASAIPDLTYAYHFDAGLYAKMLRSYAEARGVRRVEGDIGGYDKHGESGDLVALELTDGRRIEGQLFIDCTGFRGLLIGGAMNSAYRDWSNFLPCDRALAVPCERAAAMRPYTQSMARTAGWQWRIPLQHRTGNGHVYSSALLSDDDAAAMLLANLDGAALDDPRPLRFTAGRRDQFWSGNVVALGLAAGFMEPLESTSIHLVQSGIARLIDFFPARGIEPADRDQFNKLSVFEWERIRDFIVLHYKANERHGEPFWDACRDMAIPDSLTEKLDLFRATGRIHRVNEELFTEEGWSQVMIGQGVMPRAWHPIADEPPRSEVAGFLDTLRSAYRRKSASLPSHDEFITRTVTA